MKLEEVKDALAKRGFEVVVYATGKEAADAAFARAERAENVGWGGSETIKEIGLRDRIVSAGKEIRDHRTDCDLFLLSANALTADGRIVNIDGNGNRVAASIYGPNQVLFIIGRNKIVRHRAHQTVRLPAELSPPEQTHPVCRDGEVRGLRFARPHLQGDRDPRASAHAYPNLRVSC